MTNRYLSILFLLVALPGVLSAQMDTLSRTEKGLSEAVIKASKSEWKKSESRVLDSTTFRTFAASTVSDLLSMSQAVHVKSYGNAGLATIAYRGLDATALNVTWKGAVLNPAFNATTDFSLIPAFFFDKADFYSNTSDQNIPGGSTGANLVLDQKKYQGPNTKKSFMPILGGGSYGRIFGGVRIRNEEPGLKASIQTYFSRADNDYEYWPIDVGQDAAQQRLQNAAVATFGVMLDIEDSVGNGVLDYGAWVQKTTRQLPATLLESPSAKAQSDQFLVLAANWRKADRKKIQKLNNSLYTQGQLYSDSNANIENLLVTQMVQNQYSLVYFLNDHLTFNSLTSSVLSFADNNNYSDPKSRWYGVQNASLQYHTNNWKLITGARFLALKEAYNLRPYASVRNKLSKWLSWHLSSETVNRIPTMNELYWVPGGNIDLDPMRAWKNEMGVHLNNRLFSWSNTAYWNRIKSYIEWLPGNSGVFEATQHRLVTAAGVESHFSVDQSLSKTTRLVGDVTYNYVRSVLGEEINESVSQRSFVPVHSFAINFGYTFKNLQVSYIHSYTSDRNTLADAQETVPGFEIADLNLSYTLKSFIVSSRIRNVWDEEYFVLPYRPMPGRNFEISITYNFSKEITQ